jgi:hypothetical protein
MELSRDALQEHSSTINKLVDLALKAPKSSATVAKRIALLLESHPSGRKRTRNALLIKVQTEFLQAMLHEDNEPGTSWLPQLGRAFGQFYMRGAMTRQVLTIVCTDLLEQSLKSDQLAPESVYSDGVLELLRSSSPGLKLTDIMTIEKIIRRSKLVKSFLNELQFVVSDWGTKDIGRNSYDSRSRAASSKVLAETWTQQGPSAKRLKR